MARSVGTILLVSTDDVEPGLFTNGEFIVQVVRGGQAGPELAARELPGVIVADLPLRDMPALDFISGLREWSTSPIIALSANASPQAIASLLDAGADDCVVKPYGLDEFRARVKVAFRHRMRQREDSGPILKMGGTVVDLANKTVTKNGDPIHLAPIEFQLLAELVKQPGKVVTQRRLILKIWQHASKSNLPVLRAYIAILRKKVSPYPDGDIVIETIPGVGYRLFHTWTDDTPSSE